MLSIHNKSEKVDNGHGTRELDLALGGEHTAEVLREFGHTDETMEMLRKEGILIEKED